MIWIWNNFLDNLKPQNQFRKRHPGKMKVIRPYDPLDDFRKTPKRSRKRDPFDLGNFKI